LVKAGRAPDDLSSIVVCQKSGRALVNSDAVLTIAAGLEGKAFKMLASVGKIVPQFLRDAVYSYVSKNRQKLSSDEYLGEYLNGSCRVDFDGEFDNRFVPDMGELSSPSETEKSNDKK